MNGRRGFILEVARVIAGQDLYWLRVRLLTRRRHAQADSLQPRMTLLHVSGFSFDRRGLVPAFELMPQFKRNCAAKPKRQSLVLPGLVQNEEQCAPPILARSRRSRSTLKALLRWGVTEKRAGVQLELDHLDPRFRQNVSTNPFEILPGHTQHAGGSQWMMANSEEGPDSNGTKSPSPCKAAAPTVRLPGACLIACLRTPLSRS